MITFDCPHCSNPFSVLEKHAGRDGWCRICKRLVIVPYADGSGPKWPDLSLQEKVDRLDAKLQYAAAQADHYKLLMARYCERLTRIVTKERIRIHHVDEKTLHSCLRVVKHELVRLRKKTKEQDSPTQSGVDILTPLDDGSLKERDELKIALEEAERIIQEMRGELAAANESLAATQEKNDRLADELDTERDALEEAEKEARAAEKLRFELERLRESAGTSEKSVKELRAQRQVLIEEVQSVRTELDAATHERDEARERAIAVAAELGAIRDQFSAAAAARDEAQSLVQQLQSELEKLRADLAQSREAAISANALADSRATEIDHLKGEVSASTQALSDASVREAALAAELDALRTQIDAITQDKSGLTAQAEATVESQARQLEEVRNELDRTIRQRREMETLRDQHAAELQRIQDELAGNRKQVDELRDEHRRELGALRSELEDTARARDHALAENERQAEKLEGIIDRFGASAQEIEQSHSREVDAMREKMAAADERALALAKELATLRAELEDAQAAASAATANQSALAAAAEANSGELVREIAEKTARIRDVEEQRGVVESKLEESRANIARLEAELADLKIVRAADKTISANGAAASKTAAEAKPDEKPAKSDEKPAKKIIDFASSVGAWGDDDEIEGEEVEDWALTPSDANRARQQNVWAAEMEGIEAPADDDPIVVSYMRFLNSRGKADSVPKQTQTKNDEATGSG